AKAPASARNARGFIGCEKTSWNVVLSPGSRMLSPPTSSRTNFCRLAVSPLALRSLTRRGRPATTTPTGPWMGGLPVLGSRKNSCFRGRRRPGSATLTRAVTSADPVAGEGRGNKVKVTDDVLFVGLGSSWLLRAAVAENGPAAVGMTVKVNTVLAPAARSGTARVTTL